MKLSILICCVAIALSFTVSSVFAVEPDLRGLEVDSSLLEAVMEADNFEVYELGDDAILMCGSVPTELVVQTRATPFYTSGVTRYQNYSTFTYTCDEPNCFRCDLYMTNDDSTANIEYTYSFPYNSDYVSITREVKVGMTDAQYVLSNTGNGLDFTFDCEVRPVVFLSAAWSFMADPI